MAPFLRNKSAQVIVAMVQVLLTLLLLSVCQQAQHEHASDLCNTLNAQQHMTRYTNATVNTKLHTCQGYTRVEFCQEKWSATPCTAVFCSSNYSVLGNDLHAFCLMPNAINKLLHSTERVSGEMAKLLEGAVANVTRGPGRG